MYLLMRKLLILITINASIFLTACAEDPIINRLPFVYRIDVQQGNVITQDMVNQLRIGMNKRQAQFVLGAPMLNDPFHADRWDYFYEYQPGSNGKSPATRQRVSLIFEDDRLTDITGTMLPNPKPGALPPSRQVTVVVPPQELESVGILTLMWRWFGFGASHDS
ncbi:MAG TPA: outer membrane protein assembly factor BamE [Gammaproteobacteria bacterium]|nr:outer membrane protein assembly factor BamE [Gammaproteobacteria bacterium]